ncbi:hypothetical protein CAAN1_06S05468 [[Candida] anglica]|uniref:Complex 1 LYR protein domain-containing protein n=1 Tax=[Candida] anglica TaxID=148631 RepID=A0ABP0EL27_9ASCO
MCVFQRSLWTSSRLLKRRPVKDFLSLDEWLFRKEVFKLYRNVVRAAYKTHQRNELLAYAKAEFKQNNNASELAQRKYLLNIGTKHFEDMSKSIGLGS